RRCDSHDPRARESHRALPYRWRARTPRAGRHAGVELSRDRARNRGHGIWWVRGARIRAHPRAVALLEGGGGGMHRLSCAGVTVLVVACAPAVQPSRPAGIATDPLTWKARAAFDSAVQARDTARMARLFAPGAFVIAATG